MWTVVVPFDLSGEDVIEQLVMLSPEDMASLVTHSLVLAFLLPCFTSLSPLFLLSWDCIPQ